MNITPALDTKAPERPLDWYKPVIPAAAFGIVLGLGGLANAWRAAEQTTVTSPDVV